MENLGGFLELFITTVSRSLEQRADIKHGVSNPLCLKGDLLEITSLVAKPGLQPISQWLDYHPVLLGLPFVTVHDIARWQVERETDEGVGPGGSELAPRLGCSLAVGVPSCWWILVFLSWEQRKSLPRAVCLSVSQGPSRSPKAL